jgi:hypothetical protein
MDLGQGVYDPYQDAQAEPDDATGESAESQALVPYHGADDDPDEQVADVSDEAGIHAQFGDYLAKNPPLDFHNDPQALKAIMPETPALPSAQDASHPTSKSKLGKMWQIAGPMLRDATLGGIAGAAGGNMGQGLMYGQQAVQNLQRLQMERQAAKDLSDWHQAQTQKVRAQTLGMPQQQTAMNAYRGARTNYLDAQGAFLKARTDKLKQAPSDKLINTYHAADGKVHLVFERPSGDAYEKVSDASFFVHPAAKPRPLVAHGHDGIYLIDPETSHAHKVIDSPTAPRKGTPGQFASVEKWKNSEFNKIQNNVLLSDAEKTSRLQTAQDMFERVVKTLGGEPSHYVVPQQGSAPQLGSGQPSSQNDPWKLR